MVAEYIYSIAFYVTAAVAIASAIMVVWHKNPVINALYLVLCFFSVAVAYVLLDAHFLAAIQILLYAGAILVLFLMIVMLINVDERLLKARPTVGKVIGGFAALGIALLLVIVFKHHTEKRAPIPEPANMEALLIYMNDAIIDQLEKEKAELETKLDKWAEPDRPDLKSKLDDQLNEIEAKLLKRKDKEFSPRGEALVSEFDAADRVKLALAGLSALSDKEQQLFINLPEEIDSLKGKKRAEFKEIVAEQLKKPTRIKDLSVPVDFSQVPLSAMLSYIEASAEGTQRYYKEFGSTRSVGIILFSRHLLPFEFASILLLGAIIGALALSRRTTGRKES